MRVFQQQPELSKKEEQERLALLRRKTICEMLRAYPYQTVSALRDAIPGGPEWGSDSNRYGAIYHVMRQLVREGLVVETLPGPYYSLEKQEILSARILSDAIRKYDEIIPGWSGLPDVRDEILDILVKKLDALPLVQEESETVTSHG